MLPHIAILAEKPATYESILSLFPSAVKVTKQNQSSFYKTDELVLMTDTFNKPSLRNRINLVSQSDAVLLVMSDTSGYDKRLSDYLELLHFFKVPVTCLLYDNKLDASLFDTVSLGLQDMMHKHDISIDFMSLVSTDASTPQLPETMEMIREALLRPKPMPAPTEGPGSLILDGIYPRLASSLVMGRIMRGTFTVGDQVVVVGYGREFFSSISDIQVYKQGVASASAGDRVGLLLAGVCSRELTNGMVVRKRTQATAEKLQFQRFDAQIHLRSYREFGRTTPFTDGYTPLFWFRGIPVRGVITLQDNEKYASPGQLVDMTVTLESPIAHVSQSVLVTDEDHLVGSGRVVKSLE